MYKQNFQHVVILALPNSILTDISGPLEIFSKAKQKIELENNKKCNYLLHVVSDQNTKQVKTSSGISIVTEGHYKKIDFPIDTLIISGSSNLPETMINADTLNWIQQQYKTVRRICSVCSGTFILAETGILSDKKATTHWLLCEKLAQNYPKIRVDASPIFIKDGKVYTSAGITSGMDLSLALVEEDLGRSFALEIARWMVLFLKRSGNQSQFSTILNYQNIDYIPIRKTCEWILNNLNQNLTIEKLAEYALMSPRNFSRVFVRELTITPAKYIEKLRVESACRFLVESQLTLEEIALACGLKNSENMKHLFLKMFHTTPAQYRENFKSAFE